MASSENDFNPIAELSAADPARGVEPSAGFLNKVVASAVSPEPVNLTEQRESGTHTAAKAFFPWIAAGVAAALVGAGGYAFGTMNPRGPELERVIAAPAAKTQAESASMDIGSTMLGNGRFQFTASGLSEQTSSAAVYYLVPESLDGARASEIAGIFGITEPLNHTEYGWEIYGDKVGSVSFSASSSPQSSFYYYNPDASPSNNCYQTLEVPQSLPGGEDETDWDALQVQTEECLRQAMAQAPSENAVAERLSEILTQLGYAPADFHIVGTDQSEIYSDGATASAGYIVDGKVGTVGFSIVMSSMGIVSVDGTLGEFQNVGEYGVISAQQAFDRFFDPRFGPTSGNWMPWSVAEQARESAAIGGTVEDVAGLDQQSGVSGVDISPEGVQSGDHGSQSPDAQLPQSGDPSVSEPTETTQSAAPDHPMIWWPVQNVHIVSADLVYAVHWNDDNAMLLIPTYSFADSDGNTWSMIALTEDSLNFNSAS